MPPPNPPRQRGDRIDGMLLLDKPDGISSNLALQRAKRLLNARKAGHTGSLDPIATGLLPLCFGETTKISGVFLGADKRYWVRIRLGVVTDTGDREGRVLREGRVAVTRRQLDAALERFRGDYEQIPPMYSALKQSGQPLYKLAREGITVARAPRAVSVYALSVEKWSGDLLELSVSCSRGFYIRALARDLGDALGCGAHVRELRRTAVGDFPVEDALTLEQLEAAGSPEARRKFLLPTDRVLTHLPAVNLPDDAAFRLRQGQSVQLETAATAAMARSENDLVRVYSDSAGFIGLAEVSDDGKVTPKRIFNTPNPPDSPRPPHDPSKPPH